MNYSSVAQASRIEPILGGKMSLRRATDRGLTKTDWLYSRHSFSFAEYFDPHQMGFRDLRVINEDIVQPMAGFATHGHRDMEIITYVVEGAVAHKDSMGNTTTIKAGEVQVMTAGRGILHSEYNPSRDEALRLLQIWIKPERLGLTPGYGQRLFTRNERLNKFRLLVSPLAEDNSLKIHQAAKIYGSILQADKTLHYSAPAPSALWIQVVTGELDINGESIRAGDGLAMNQVGPLTIKAVSESEFLLFELA
jgi:quercetin 2,3-dioxygenase